MSSKNSKSDKQKQIQTDLEDHPGNRHSDDSESMLNEIYDEDEDITHQPNPVKPQRTLFSKSKKVTNKHDEPVQSKTFSNFFKSQTSKSEHHRTETTAGNKSKVQVSKGLKVKHDKKEVNDVEYDDDDADELINAGEVNPDEGQIYDDDETDFNKEEIKNKKSSNSILEKEKNFKFKVDSKNKIHPSSKDKNKDKNSKNLKSKIKLGKKTPLNIYEGNSQNEEICDDDKIQIEMEVEIDVTDKRTKNDVPNITGTKDHEASFLIEEYDEDEDHETSHANAENLQDCPSKSSKDTITHKSSSVLSSTYFMNKLKGQGLNIKSKVKNSKCNTKNKDQEGPQQNMDNGELYDDDTFEIKEGEGSIDIGDGMKNLLIDRDELNDIYDDDEEFQEQTKAKNNIKYNTYDNSAALTESVSVKSSKLESSKKYFNQKMKNFKIKEKSISDNFKRKVKKIKTFSTSPRVDKIKKNEEIDENDMDEEQEDIQELYDVDDDLENEPSVSNEIGDVDSITNKDKTKHKISSKLNNKSVTKVYKSLDNLKAKGQMKNEIQSKYLVDKTAIRDEVENQDVPSLHKEISHNLEEEDEDIYDDGGENEAYEEQSWGNENKALTKSSSLADSIVTKQDDVAESSSRLEPLSKFVNRNLKNLKKSKKLISEKLISAFQTLKEISINQNTVDRDEGIEEYESDDLDYLQETKSNLQRSNEINDTCGSVDEREKSEASRPISNNDDDSRCNDDTECSVEESIVQKNTTKSPNYFSDKQKGLNTKVKRFSNNFKQVILNRNANRKEKKINDIEQNENGKVGNDGEECSLKDDPTGKEPFVNHMSDDIQIESLSNCKESKKSNHQDDKITTEDGLLFGKKIISGKPSRSKSSSKFKSLKSLKFKKSEKRVTDTLAVETSSISQQIGKDFQKENNLGISSFPTDMLDEWFNSKMQSLMIQFQEKTATSPSQNCESMLGDLNRVLSTSTIKEKEEVIESEVHEVAPEDQGKAVISLTGSRSFPLSRKRYNVKMCLEYFDRAGDIVSIETEILRNRQQKISIILGEASSVTIFESDLKNLLKYKSQDKNNEEQSELSKKCKTNYTNPQSNGVKESKLKKDLIDSNKIRKSLPKEGKINVKNKSQNIDNSQKVDSQNKRNLSESKDKKELKKNPDFNDDNVKVPNKSSEKKIELPKQSTLRNDKSKFATPPKESQKLSSQKRIPRREVNPDNSIQNDDDSVKMEKKLTMKNDSNKNIPESDLQPPSSMREAENKN